MSWARFRVTVVAIVAVLILLTLVYLLSGASLLEQQIDLYVYVPDATGIYPGAAVAVNGITVGSVESVKLTGSNQPDRIVRIQLDIARDHLRTITEDSYVQIASDSLVGDKYISITSGTSPNSVRPNGELHFKAQVDLMTSLDLTQFEKQLESVDVMLSDIESGKSAVGRFILGDQMYTDLNRRLTQIGQAVHAAADTSSSLGEALYTDQLYQKIREPIVKVDQDLARLQSGQGSGGQFLRDTGQFESLRSDIAGLRKNIADFRNNDLMASSQMYADWNRMVAGWIRQVDRMNSDPLFNTSEMYDNLNGAVKEMQDGVKDFRQNPQKFLRLKLF